MNKEQFYKTVIGKFADAATSKDLDLAEDFIQRFKNSLTVGEWMALIVLLDIVKNSFCQARDRYELCRCKKDIEKLDKRCQELANDVINLTDIIENLSESNEKLIRELQRKDKFFL